MTVIRKSTEPRVSTFLALFSSSLLCLLCLVHDPLITKMSGTPSERANVEEETISNRNDTSQDRSPSPTVLDPASLVESHSQRSHQERLERSERPETSETRYTRHSVLDTLTLPPPPAYDLFINGLSIGVPPPTNYLPLPVPIPVPRVFLRNQSKDYLDQTIIRDVNVHCGSGEVLAM